MLEKSQNLFSIPPGGARLNCDAVVGCRAAGPAPAEPWGAKSWQWRDKAMKKQVMKNTKTSSSPVRFNGNPAEGMGIDQPKSQISNIKSQILHPKYWRNPPNLVSAHPGGARPCCGVQSCWPSPSRAVGSRIGAAALGSSPAAQAQALHFPQQQLREQQRQGEEGWPASKLLF